jgi:membrane fusion protein, multidrug efflux system
MKKIVTLFILTITVCFLSACGDKSSSNKRTVRAIPVETKNILKKTVPIYIDTFGSFQASKDVNIESMIKGQVIKVYFTNGAFVKKGQLLFQIDSAIYKAQLENNKAVLQKDYAALNMKKSIYARGKKLIDRSIISKEEFEQAKTDLEIAKAEVQTALANIKEYLIDIEYCNIHSPISGIIGINSIDEGNIVNQGDILANVKTVSPLYINFTVPENDIARIKNALDEGSLKLQVLVNEKEKNGAVITKKYDGKLDFLNNTANHDSGTISLKGIVDNSKKTIYPGQFAKIRLIVGDLKDALLIPREAVRQGPDSRYVYVVDSENKAEKIDVIPGQEYDQYYSVIKGKIKESDKVVVSGLLNLSSGALVKASPLNAEKVNKD